MLVLPYKTLASSLTFALLLALGCGRDMSEPLPPQVGMLIKETLETEAVPAALRDQPERQVAWEDMQRFYKLRLHTPAWVDAEGPLPHAEQLVAAIDSLGREGLDPRRYAKEHLEGLIAGARSALEEGSLDDPEVQRRLVDLDLHLTFTFMTMASHMATGRLQPRTLDVGWYTKPRPIDLDRLLVDTLDREEKGEQDFGEALLSLAPPQEEYARLRDALARYRQIAKAGGWPAVPEGELEEGATGEAVRALRARLAASGDLAAPEERSQEAVAGSDAFDPAVADAVRRFQRRHGLEETGVVDAGTREALNVPVEERLRQILVNLERWRWLPHDLGGRYILVNVPDYSMTLVEGDREAMHMRVVVGKEQSATPVFSGKMTYLELNPAWNVPDSILQQEILPAMSRDPGYLARNNMEVVPGEKLRVRQRPGPGNALGRIKFMFPNQHNVYLHDTPAGHLFAREERDFSHGCVRIEKPLELAAYLLKDDPKWSPESIRTAIDSGEQKTVTLPKPIAVHILYWTAWADADGTVHFRKDVYGHDPALAEALAEEPPVTLDPKTIRGEQRAEVRPRRAT